MTDELTDLEDCKEACREAREGIDHLIKTLRYEYVTDMAEAKLIAEWIDDEMTPDCPTHFG